jgi:polygalacturonase
MKRELITLLGIVLLSVATPQQLNAQIAFSMTDEEASKNTPEGWSEVQLPQNLPAITAANTFYITDYGASTSSADNTAAIQAALNAAQTAGGGMVVVPAGEWLFGRIQIGSKTILHLCAGAMLKVLAYSNQPDHTTKTPYITNKNGASDIVIEGESKETSIIEGQGGPWWDAVEQKESGLQRGSLIRFENGNGSRFLFRHFRMQNAPSTNLTLGNSGRGTHNTVHDVSIYAPASHGVADPSHNTDGIPIWAPYANIYNCDIDTGDDNVVTDSNAQFIHVWNCHFKAGHGASLGSYTVNMHDIIYEDITFEGTDCGFRLKSNRDRSGDVYNLTCRNCTMTGVMNPIQITAWYDTLPKTPEAAAASPESVITTTPKFRDITFENVTVSGYTGSASGKNGYGIFIYGRPESLVKNVSFKNVHIRHAAGMKLNFCEGITFDKQCWYAKTSTGKTSTAAGINNVIDEQYQCSYTWNGTEPDVTDVVLSGSTYNASASSSSSYSFNGGYSITNTKSKGYAAGNSATIKYSASVQYTIVAPAGKAISAVSFTGYSNYDPKEGTTAGSWLAEVNGTSYGETDYPFIHDGNKSNFRTYTIPLATPVTGGLTFTPASNQSCFIITVTVANSTTAISAVKREEPTVKRQPFNLLGQPVSDTYRGIVIQGGRKVVKR